MSGGGGGLSKLGTVLTIIFVVSLAALLAELFYVLWRRRVFRRRTSSVGVGGGDQLSQFSSSESAFSPIASSKELLYFFCIRPQSRLDGNTVADNNTAINGVNSNRQPEMEVIDIDLMKIQGMFGPPRFLFTIKEEEREDMDSPAERSAGREAKKSEERGGIRRVRLEDCLKAAEEETAVVVDIDDAEEETAVVVDIDDAEEETAVVVDIDDATPFSTPCASPLYFTPSDSPIHEEVVNDPSTGGGEAPVVRLEV